MRKGRPLSSCLHVTLYFFSLAPPRIRTHLNGFVESLVFWAEGPGTYMRVSCELSLSLSLSLSLFSFLRICLLIPKSKFLLPQVRAWRISCPLVFMSQFRFAQIPFPRLRLHALAELYTGNARLSQIIYILRNKFCCIRWVRGASPGLSHSQHLCFHISTTHTNFNGFVNTLTSFRSRLRFQALAKLYSENSRSCLLGDTLHPVHKVTV